MAVLPDPGGWLSSDTKVYKTVVTIDEEVDQIKPGMTAVVEIHIDSSPRHSLRSDSGHCAAR